MTLNEAPAPLPCKDVSMLLCLICLEPEDCMCAFSQCITQCQLSGKQDPNSQSATLPQKPQNFTLNSSWMRNQRVATKRVFHQQAFHCCINESFSSACLNRSGLFLFCTTQRPSAHACFQASLFLAFPLPRAQKLSSTCFEVCFRCAGHLLCSGMPDGNVVPARVNSTALAA